HAQAAGFDQAVDALDADFDIADGRFADGQAAGAELLPPLPLALRTAGRVGHAGLALEERAGVLPGCAFALVVLAIEVVDGLGVALGGFLCEEYGGGVDAAEVETDVARPRVGDGEGWRDVLVVVPA